MVNSYEINLDKIDNQRIHTEICLMQISSLGKIENNSSKKKKHKEDDKLNEVQVIKNDHYSTENLKYSATKTNLEEKEITKNVIVKNTTNSDQENKELSSFSLASVEKKRHLRKEKNLAIY